jgi:septal ring factor EnvC (AmiA/AmiB activator)
MYLKLIKRLKRIEKKLDKIFEKERLMAGELDVLNQSISDLEDEVAGTEGEEASAIVLLQGIGDQLTTLANQLTAAGLDASKVVALRDRLAKSREALAAAVAAVPPAA